jgi:hypothetical protein
MHLAHPVKMRVMSEVPAHKNTKGQEEKEAEQEGRRTNQEREEKHAWDKTAVHWRNGRPTGRCDSYACCALSQAGLIGENPDGGNSSQEHKPGNDTQNPKVFHVHTLTRKIFMILSYDYVEPMDKSWQE